MNETITMYDELVKNYATNDIQENYINSLGEETLNEVYGVIKYLEENETASYEDILEQALVHCVHTYDFETLEYVEKLSQLTNYTQLHELASESEYSLSQDEFGNTTANIKMKNENFVIMSLTGTLEKLKDMIYEEAVATDIKISDLEGNEY